MFQRNFASRIYIFIGIYYGDICLLLTQVKQKCSMVSSGDIEILRIPCTLPCWDGGLMLPAWTRLEDQPTPELPSFSEEAILSWKLGPTLDQGWKACVL